MPIEGNVRYVYKKRKKGKGRVRLAFRGDDVVEAKNMATGATHTPAEFAADRKRRKGRRNKK